jgi:hypothetical protein
MFNKTEEIKTNEKAKRDRELAEHNPDYYRLFKSQFGSEGDRDYEIKLYRREYTTRGKQPKKFLKRYINYVPLEEEIGEEYGGGTFWLVGWDEDGNEDGTYLHIDESYTAAYKKRMAAEQYQGPQQQADPLTYTSKIMTDIVRPMLEMAGAGKNNNNGSSMKMIEGIAESFSKGLIKMQSAMIQQKLEHIQEMNKKPAPIKPDEHAWLKDVLEFAKPFVGSFLTAKGKPAEWMKNLLVNDERFQKIQEDDLLFKALYTMGCQDQEIGPEKMDSLFKKAGFEIPGDDEEEADEDEPQETEETETARNS